MIKQLKARLLLNVLLLVCYLVLPNVTNSQTIVPISYVTYSYDDAGNRKSRVITIRELEPIPFENKLTTTSDSSIPFPSVKAEHEIEDKTQPNNDNIGFQDILIYPNPTKGRLWVEFSSMGSLNQVQVSVYKSNGILISILKTNNSAVEINLESYPNGLYLLVITIDKQSSTWKIIKQ
jgi:hypothetical protein